MSAVFNASWIWVFYCSLTVILSVVIALLILRALRKRFPHEQLKKHHDVAGATLSIVGILYSVILGFTIINEQDRYNDLVKAIHTEAILIADLYEDAIYFNEANCKEIRDSLKNYVNHVIKTEWGYATDKHIHADSRGIIKAIWDSYYNVELTDDKTKIWYTESIGKLNNLLNARLERHFNSWEHLGSIMWSLLIVGGIITLGFMFFFGVENFGAQMIMIALLSGYLSFMLFLVYSLDHVFSRPQRIEPTAFEQITELFENWEKVSFDDPSAPLFSLN